MRSREVQALKDAGEILHMLADTLAQQQYDRLPAANDLSSFADHCQGLAREADDRMVTGEHLVDEDDIDDGKGREDR